MQNHRVVSRDEWMAAGKALLAREKEETHLRDAVNAERLALPWMRVEQVGVLLRQHVQSRLPRVLQRTGTRLGHGAVQL
jgi:predicted dithiol-disulfide oxidoreductase (DUF899 family)